jgi:hypothetical protein
MQPTTTRFFLKQLSLLVLIKKITRINHISKDHTTVAVYRCKKKRRR